MAQWTKYFNISANKNNYPMCQPFMEFSAE